MVIIQEGERNLECLGKLQQRFNRRLAFAGLDSVDLSDAHAGELFQILLRPVPLLPKPLDLLSQMTDNNVRGGCVLLTVILLIFFFIDRTSCDVSPQYEADEKIFYSQPVDNIIVKTPFQ